jgi:beta-mannanase
MKTKVILILLTGLILTGCQRATIHSVTLRQESGRHLMTPPHGIYTGAYVDFGETEDEVTLEQMEKFEKMVGKHQAIIASSSYWGQQSFPQRNLEIISRHGSIPLVYWSPWDKPYNQDAGPDRFSLEAVLRGEWDAYIDSWGRQARDYGKPFFVAWGLEMNGSWFPWSGMFYGGGSPLSGMDQSSGPEMYKRAYRHVVDRVRARGATNVLWVFHANNYSYPNDTWNTISRYYPGKEYVDWLGISVYGKQFNKDKWVNAYDCLIYAYRDLEKIDPDKPIMLAEWGIGEFPSAGNKAAWIQDAMKLMKTACPRLKAAVFWHERWQNSDGSYSNLRVSSSLESLEAYRAGVADPFWLATPVWKP